MTDFFADAEWALLERNKLANFYALWAVQLEAVDEPNTSGGGWSRVFRMDLEGQGFYLKRQSNYLSRTLYSPLGEPSCAREFRNIERYRQLGIPALEAVFFGERKLPGERRAILMTRALDSWTDLDSLLEQWPQLTVGQQQAILQACGQLARRLHAVHQVHGCFYPKHIFLQSDGAAYSTQLIDLEKTRPLLLGQRDRIKDIEPLLRRAHAWTEADVRILFAAYLEQPADSGPVDAWYQRLNARRSYKETR